MHKCAQDICYTHKCIQMMHSLILTHRHIPFVLILVHTSLYHSIFAHTHRNLCILLYTSCFTHTDMLNEHKHTYFLCILADTQSRTHTPIFHCILMKHTHLPLHSLTEVYIHTQDT